MCISFRWAVWQLHVLSTIQQHFLFPCHINTVRLWVSDSIKHLVQTNSSRQQHKIETIYFCYSLCSVCRSDHFVVVGSIWHTIFCQRTFALVLLSLLPIFLPGFFLLAFGTWCACFITLWLFIRYGKKKINEYQAETKEERYHWASDENK